MSETVKRVARAMCAEWYRGGNPDASDHVGVEDYDLSRQGLPTKNWHLFTRSARVAIEALRVLTPEVAQALEDHEPREDARGPATEIWAEAWSAAIDAALATSS